jgi:hypothetical protein
VAAGSRRGRERAAGRKESGLGFGAAGGGLTKNCLAGDFCKDGCIILFFPFYVKIKISSRVGMFGLAGFSSDYLKTGGLF